MKRGWVSVLDLASSVVFLATAAVVLWLILRPGPNRSIAMPHEPVSLSGAELRGDVHAPIAIIEFGDFECTFCRRFARTILPALEERYLKTGAVVFAFRNLPLTRIHPHAMRAARVAACSQGQERFWPVFDQLYQNDDLTGVLGNDDIAARSLGLQPRSMASCMSGGGIDKRIQYDMAQAAELGISSTPVFLVGQRRGDQSVRVTRVLQGVRSIDDFTKAIVEAGRTALYDVWHRTILWTCSGAAVALIGGMSWRWRRRSRTIALAP